MSAAPKVATAPPAPKRMSIGNIVSGVLEVPDRIMVSGVEGIGKSSFAAAFPSPVFIEPEADGSARIKTSRMPTPESWQDILDGVDVLTTDAHEYKTVVVDTLDAAEPMLWKHICDRDKKDSIEGYGFGKGYVAALDEWRVFLSRLEKLRRDRKMGVVLIAHTSIRAFKNPEGEDYDRYELKLNAKAGGLLKEWSDAVLFAHYETFAVKADDKARAKGVSTGARVIHTQRTAAWDAKNRYSLPATLPLDYALFADAVNKRQVADPAKLKESIAAKLVEIANETVTAKVTADLVKAGDDAEALAKIENKLTATLSARTKGA